MCHNYVVIRTDTLNTIYDYIFYDLKTSKQALYINKSFLFLLVKIVFFIFKYNHKIFIKMKNLIIILFIIYIMMRIKLHFKNKRSFCFILFQNKYNLEKFGLIKYLRYYFSYCKIIYFFTDIIEMDKYKELFLKNFRKQADLIYSYDFGDANKYNLKFHNVPYSNIAYLFPYKKLKYDICFIGSAKNRLWDLISVYKRFSSQGLNCGFFVTGVKKRNQVLPDKINYIKEIPYTEYLKIIVSSKCMLELIQSNSKGNTVRVDEAIIFDKLLISNNPYLVKNELYNSKYMRIINNINEFDAKTFIESIKEVHYENKEKVYPSAFFEQIEKDLMSLD